MNQEERLEVAQGQAETSLVQANMLLHMPDYSHLQQAETIISGIKSQLGEEDVPLYQGPVTHGDIPIYINPLFPEEINDLGVVGGGEGGRAGGPWAQCTETPQSLSQSLVVLGGLD